MGPFPRAQGGYKFLFAAIDMFTKGVFGSRDGVGWEGAISVFVVFGSSAARMGSSLLRNIFSICWMKLSLQIGRTKPSTFANHAY